jgi:hypothetical protein
MGQLSEDNGWEEQLPVAMWPSWQPHTHGWLLPSVVRAHGPDGRDHYPSGLTQGSPVTSSWKLPYPVHTPSHSPAGPGTPTGPP